MVFQQQKQYEKDFKYLLKTKKGRRDFIKYGGLTLLGYFLLRPVHNETIAVFTEAVHEARKKLFARPEDTKYEIDLINKLFGDIRNNYRISPGFSHYQYKSQIHPDDITAGATLQNLGFRDITKLTVVSNLITPEDLDGNLILLGSPVSNYLSRAVLQYTQKTEDQKDGLIREPAKPFFDLPFEYIFDSRNLRKIMPESIEIETKEHGVPNWSIKEVNASRILSPKKGKNKNWVTDYLLITILPNIFVKSSYENNQKIIIFGGVHGPGTKAIELLFQNKKILKNLISKIERFDYWQALIEVNDVKLSSKTNRYEPVLINDQVLWTPVQINRKEIEGIWT